MVELYDEVLGVGVELLPNTCRSLEQIGLLPDVVQAGVGYDRMIVHDAKGNFISESILPQVASPSFPPAVAITRPAFAQLARKHALGHGARLDLGISVHELHDTGQAVDVSFTNSRRATYDLVIGFDGAQSMMRPLVFGDALKPNPVGLSCFRCFLPRLPGVDQVLSFHATNRVVLVPLGKDIMYFPLTSVLPPDRRLAEAELSAMVVDLLDDYSAPIIQKVRSMVSKDSYIVYRPLTELLVPDPWYRGRIIVLGDAAHSFPPHLGMGAGMAIEDGVVLAEELSLKPIEQALSDFMHRRFDRVEMVWRNAIRICEWDKEAGNEVEMQRLTDESFAHLSAAA